MAFVLDAHALIAYLEKEPGHEKMKELLTEADLKRRPLLLSLINWGEIFYVTMKRYGGDAAEKVAKLIETFPIEVVPPDTPLVKQAAVFKASHKMSYADSFAAALAKMRKAALVTGDRDFKSVEEKIKINWL